MALATDVVAESPNPHIVETTRTPTKYTTPNASWGATCLSNSTTTDSPTMNDAATTRPSHTGGRFARSNSATMRARTGDAPTSVSACRPRDVTAGRDDGQPGACVLLRVIRPAQIDRCGH